jgi:hypothetical protein
MPNDYGPDEQIRTFTEKLLPPIATYLVRKLNLGLVLLLLFVARQLSKPYGFSFSAEVSDRESWKWELHKKLPLYRAQLEKVN